MSHAPIVMLDTANLLFGEYTKVDEAKSIIDRHLPLIDRCCVKTWGNLPKVKHAFSLSSIRPEIHEYLEGYGYQVHLASPIKTITMKIEKASKLDDYELNRMVKKLVTEEKERDFLIVSGDQDFESLATQMSIYGTKFFYVQRQKKKYQQNLHFTRFSTLREFIAPLAKEEEMLLKKAEQNSLVQLIPNSIHSKEIDLKKASSENSTFSIIYQQKHCDAVQLFDDFKIGRTSERIGRADLCLARFDQHKQYSRHLAQIFKMGDAWILWRPPLDQEKLAKQPIVVSQQNYSYELGSGESVLLENGDQIHLKLCDVTLEFHN